MGLCDYRAERIVRAAHWDELNGLPPQRRAAEKFRFALERVSLEVRDGDEIVGWFAINGEDCPFRAFDDEAISDEERAVIEQPSLFGSRTSVDKGHTLVDYGEVLSIGLRGYEERIDQALLQTPGHDCLCAMKSCITAVKAFTKRMAEELDAKITSSNEEEAHRLKRLRDMMRRMPYEPAQTFREAVQAVWLIHFLIPLAENSWASISLGRFDRYMQPFYEKALASGENIASMKAVLHNFYELLNNYADGACLLNVGPDYTSFSRLLIDCQKEFAMPAPILGARVDDETEEDVWDALIDPALFSMGQPTFYGENSCLRALAERGVPSGEAVGFSNNSCMGIALPGREFDSMWGYVLIVPAAVEAALCAGRLVSGREVVPGLANVSSIDQAFENFERSAAHFLNIGVRSYELRARHSEKTDPDPFLSLLTKSCIDKRCDRISGADYHNVTVECMGMINAADALCAVDELVFKSGRHTLDELVEALRDDFKGHEALWRELLACPKFGRDVQAEAYAVRVADILQRLIRSHDHDTIHYSPSLHTIDTNVGYGAGWGAGFDGRRAGTPFAKNAGPSNEARSADPTAMVLASSALPQSAFYGGQPLDVNFQLSTVCDHKREIEALIKVYLGRGALQFQVNALSPSLLREAANNPDAHPNLVVRIGGYSAYFRNLARSTQLEFVERIEKESGASDHW